MDLTEKLRNHIGRVGAGDRIAIIYDTDPDGICAAVIAAKALKRLGKNAYINIGISHSGEILTERILLKLKSLGIRHTIICDLAVDTKPEKLAALNRFSKAVIIDHHKLYNNLNSENILLIKPQLIETPIEPSQYCSSKLAYDLFSKITDIPDCDWISVIGIIADSSYGTWKRYCDRVMAKHGSRIKKDAFDTGFGKICNLMAYYEIYSRGKTKWLFELLLHAKSYKELSVIKRRIPEDIEKGIDDYCRNFREHSVSYRDSVIIDIKNPKFLIGAILSTRLGFIFPHKTVIVIQKRGKRIFVNGRRMDFRVAVNGLLEKSITGLRDASAGGHVPSAGASLKSSDYNLFYTNLTKNLAKGSTWKKGK